MLLKLEGDHLKQQIKSPKNLVELIEGSVKEFSDSPLFGTKNSQGNYDWVTYAEVGKRVDHLRSGLAGIGIKRGDSVGVIVDNSTEWGIAAFATYGLGARFIPMYEKELEKIWEYIIKDSSIKVLLVLNKSIQEKILSRKNNLPELEHVYTIEGSGELSMKALEDQGLKNLVPAIHPDPDDIAALIYTSGTTGNPKGVLISHKNFCTNFYAGSILYPKELRHNCRSLSILPWAHSFGQTAEFYNFINVGGSMGFMEKVSTIGEDMEKVKPTLLIAVPRVFNKIYAGLFAKMEETGGLPQKLFLMGINSAKRKRELSLEGKSEFITNLKYKIADKIVFKKIRAKFGGLLEGAITASATMNVEIGHFFSDLGIPVYDCYGLSETSPAVTMNCPGAMKLGSVGRPIKDVKVVIEKMLHEPCSDEGEIVVYGPNVMHGYHNNPGETAKVMTEDGGFKTGDRGRLDSDGFLYITGRFKEQYKLENGKYVFPAAIEEEIKLNPYVANTLIYGEGRAFNICMVVPDFEALEKIADEHKIKNDPASLIASDIVQNLIKKSITTDLKNNFGSYEIPKKFIFLPEDFSLENGMLTQTMKLKRNIALDKYMPGIEALYH
jgi:long-chain acyl-CoA synthetase